MQLKIRHETLYRYDEPVSYSIQALNLTPRTDAGQRVLAWRIHAPGNRIEQVDPYGNTTHLVTVESPHREMRIVVEGVADISVASTGGNDDRSELSPLAYLAPTMLTRSDPAIRNPSMITAIRQSLFNPMRRCPRFGNQAIATA